MGYSGGALFASAIVKTGLKLLPLSLYSYTVYRTSKKSNEIKIILRYKCVYY
ncbi:hypothetical protein TSAR_002390 [Trichomalopsis sarcophagae]|uniref:Uncharacterized protein n=1 Tax=Trichomalopsis sarcophagae TaxID=543379 RepID=A0A232F6R8_9HYME|nr:hypothetical protein TSAR_002390 [Trichomalopsis sarcophagae]